MDKYQVYHYYKHHEPMNMHLYWTYSLLAIIFVCSSAIPLYLQYSASGDMPTVAAISENEVQWHLEQEIAQIKAKTRRRRKKKKKGGSV